jgi:hypothetical protein
MMAMLTMSIRGRQNCRDLSTSNGRFSLYTSKREGFIATIIRNRVGSYDALLAVYLSKESMRGSNLICGDLLYAANRSPNLVGWSFPPSVEIFRNILVGSLTEHQKLNRRHACPDLSMELTKAHVVFTSAGVSLMCGSIDSGFVGLHMRYSAAEQHVVCLTYADQHIVNSFCAQMLQVREEMVNSMFASRKHRDRDMDSWPRAVVTGS